MAPPRRLLPWIGCGVIAVLYLTLAFRCAFVMSETLDERGQLPLGLRLLQSGSFEELVSHGTPPLPVLATVCLPALLAPDTPPESVAFLLLRRGINIVLFGLPLVVALFVALDRFGGWVLASAGAGLLAFSPMFLAHSAIAATDVCAACCLFLALLGIIRYTEAPGMARLAGCAVGVGLAAAAKQSTLILLAVLALAIWNSAGTRRRRIATVSGAVLVALAVDWAMYGFHVTTLTADAPWRPKFNSFAAGPLRDALRWLGTSVLLPAPVVSTVVQVVHNKIGHWTYFLGEARQTGSLVYWPVVFGVKSTVAELLLAALAL
ncbi:MAG TPA: glycosyltransferase family 39 protein, partial [Opitutaceae bacterium]|nr:glycosyltransferase family 39 protein [Opitutaceae bacterium]